MAYLGEFHRFFANLKVAQKLPFSQFRENVAKKFAGQKNSKISSSKPISHSKISTSKGVIKWVI